MTVEEIIRVTVREEVREALRPVMERLESVLTGGGPAEYLTTREAAQFAKVHPNTIRDWVATGRLAGHHAGRELRVSSVELRRLLDTPVNPNAGKTPEELVAAILKR